MSAQLWQTIAIAGFVLSAVAFLAAGIIFFMFKIPDVLAELHGKKRPGSAQVESGTKNASAKSQRWYADEKKPDEGSVVHQSMAIEDEFPESHRTMPLNQGGAEGNSSHRTMPLNQGGAEGTGSHRTMPLNQGGAEGNGSHRTMPLNQGGAEGNGSRRTTALNQSAPAPASRRTTALSYGPDGDEAHEASFVSVPGFRITKSVVVVHSEERIG